MVSSLGKQVISNTQTLAASTARHNAAVAASASLHGRAAGAAVRPEDEFNSGKLHIYGDECKLFEQEYQLEPKCLRHCEIEKK